MLNVDLHCHSNVSDGVLPPAVVAEHAHKAGVNVWALTDHDEVGDIATLLSVSQDSLRVMRYRLRKKLNMEQGESLTAFIQSL